VGFVRTFGRTNLDVRALRPATAKACTDSEGDGALRFPERGHFPEGAATG
jgi:hypothetical protein